VRHAEYLDTRFGGPFRTDLNVELRSGGEVTGRVTLPDRLPVPGYRIDTFIPGLQDASTWTGDDGRFRLRGLPSGEFRVHCDHGDPELTTCTAGTRDLRITMRHSILRVAVRDDDGRAVADARVDSEFTRLDSGEAPGRARTSALVVPPGEDVVLQVSRSGFRLARHTVPAWSRRPALNETTVTLEPAPEAAVRLRVRNADGDVPPFVRISAFVRTSSGETARQPHVFHTAEQEIIRIAQLDPGPVTLEISAGNDHRIFRRIDAMATLGASAVTEVRLPPALHLFVRWEPDPPGAGLDVRAVHPERGIPMMKVGDRYRSVTRIAPGDYLVRAVRNGKIVREERISVPGPDDFEFEWRRQACEVD